MNLFDSDEYDKHLETEKKHYNLDKYRQDLTQKNSEGLAYLHDLFQQRVKQRIGLDVWEYTIASVNNKIKENSSEAPIKILCLGTGPGGLEMSNARNFIGKYEMICMDINESSIATGQKKADAEGLQIKFIQQDINKLALPPNTFDQVFAHASLHHMINHEHIASEVYKSMKSDAEFIVYDVITRNGQKLWDDTKRVANKIFAKLPEKYRYNPQTKKAETELPDRDLSKDSGFECIRSQDLYPILTNSFKVEIDVLGFAFARHFVDHPFRDNYHMPADKAVVDKIVKLDEEHSRKDKLKPESVFLVLQK